ncbi:hypothetical protein P3X46_004144 [Hevea brasiliensis]|uniref:Mitochondrial import inner membrane translocase subunit TIM50 n=1 Tax=Hevea brasiliensis TaxID=3981 RepID=A0ABQ9MVT1_HEVBR|nr:uncharacterized protein LOC110655432 [Hevea brasiliensis]KAJ9184414.1 hypothetical protein P3X46_004144 [Hevea brasiliensis]
MERKSGSMKQKAVCCYDESDSEEDRGGLGGISLEKLSLGPKKKLLVIAPGVLCHRVRVFSKEKPKNCTPDATYGTIQVYKRPHCEDFLKFCFERFEVGIWSTTIEKNLNNTLECVMGRLKSKLLFVWGQEHCTDTGFKSLENSNKPMFLKELEKLWEKINNSRRKQYSLSNTLVIDDKPYKALLNPPNTAIFLHEYKAGEANDNVLGPKGEFRLFLDGLTEADDVPTYVKKNLLGIGQPAIGPSHPDWRYCSKIISFWQGVRKD